MKASILQAAHDVQFVMSSEEVATLAMHLNHSHALHAMSSEMDAIRRAIDNAWRMALTRSARVECSPKESP